jgi:hypothetical protein
MAIELVQKKLLDDVLRWVVHPAYCYEEITLNNGDIALLAGDQLLGRLAWNSSGTTWKILDDGDSINTSSVICPIIDQRRLTDGVAGDAASIATRCLILRRGPALVHYDELIVDAGAVVATVKAAIEAQGIQLVYETGLQYTPASVV